MPGHARHLDVRDQQVEMVRLDLLERIGAVLGADGLVAFLLERVLQVLEGDVFVFSYEDLECHMIP